VGAEIGVAAGWTVRVLNPGGSKMFFFSILVHNVSGVHPVPSTVATRVKRPGRGVEYRQNIAQKLRMCRALPPILVRASYGT
jgi:hypothetical protein